MMLEPVALFLPKLVTPSRPLRSTSELMLYIEIPPVKAPLIRLSGCSEVMLGVLARTMLSRLKVLSALILVKALGPLSKAGWLQSLQFLMHR
jgi:hypothetical protein